jgi:hypothetical protein
MSIMRSGWRIPCRNPRSCSQGLIWHPGFLFDIAPHRVLTYDPEKPDGLRRAVQRAVGQIKDFIEGRPSDFRMAKNMSSRPGIDRPPRGVGIMNVPPCAIDSIGHACWLS